MPIECAIDKDAMVHPMVSAGAPVTDFILDEGVDMNRPMLTRRTLSVLVENAAGVLSQVSRLFSEGL